MTPSTCTLKKVTLKEDLFFLRLQHLQNQKDMNESCLLPHNKERNKIKSIFNFVVEKNNANAKNNKEERMLVPA